MRSFSRRFGIMIACLLAGTSIAIAQTDDIKAVGSGIVEPPLSALVTASETETNISIEVTGTNTGFEQFCAGEADITTATRAITGNEVNACAENDIAPLALVIGQDILAFIANPDTQIAACLTGAELSTIYAPSAEGKSQAGIRSWLMARKLTCRFLRLTN